ncbi:cytochrome P450 [Streptomyces beijiangensis]|uniref:Cytochrome P450 n=1 Tax=Streptomyces beijiangensis TaxID=163361 RepID=A0A939F7H6_9ACTN|nr:cytochrome P450 [Streptomyces beijiangensis]MBO0513487.1 cytochrome P450 [Streptomyces beijiangensis]
MTEAPEAPVVDLDIIKQLLPFDPFDEDFHRDPYPTYRKIREENGQVFRTPGGTVAVLSHQVASEILKDPRFGWGENPPIADQFVPNPDGPPGRPLIFMDPPDHTRIRTLVSKAFTPRTVQRLRGRTEQFAAELVAKAREQAAGGTVDLMDALLRPLPGLVLSELMDIPERYHPVFIALAKESGRGLDPGFTLSPEEKVIRDEARDGIIAAGAEMVEERKARPGDDLVSELVAARGEGGDRLSEMELSMTLMNLLAAGFNATAAMMGNCVLSLFGHGDQVKWFLDNPSQVQNSVEELLRYDSPLQLVPRTALQDAQVGDLQVPVGTDLSLVLGAANRDPEVYDDPDRLDLSRPAQRNLGFGHGIHFCVAAPIARMTAQATVAELAANGVELALEKPEFFPGIVLRTLSELPVTFNSPK